jgi:RHS repeat-associated protein
VAVTNGPRTVLERSEYEPYGKLLNRPLADGPGYAGHVSDAATGLSYMQQRYYDPRIGVFLSVDPLTALSNPVGAFNRYWYANNNPYKFTDPDGRQPVDDSPEHRPDGARRQSPTSPAPKPAPEDKPQTPVQPQVVYKAGVPAPSAQVSALLTCTANCMGTTLRVTATSDSHAATNPHTLGNAVDMTTNQPAAVMQCAANCGAVYQQDEYAHPSANATGGHVHLQLVPGRGGATGPYYPLPIPITTYNQRENREQRE